MDKLLEHLGYGTPFIYAAAAYWLFSWLDTNTSEEAKAALARTMKLKDMGPKEIASALAEVFDQIYTYPLLHWRALFRSLAFTTIVTMIWAYEMGGIRSWLVQWGFFSSTIGVTFLTNAASDYASLFVIRRWLASSKIGPVVALVLATLSALVVVSVGTLIRLNGFVYVMDLGAENLNFWPPIPNLLIPNQEKFILQQAIPALIVFAWMPLFAIGIVAARLLRPLAWVIGKAQWFLVDGKEHPLRAIGCTAAATVFSATVILQTILEA